MNSAINSMLQKYDCKTTEEHKNALKEIVQEIALLGLHRANFFKHAAFYGGTALRIFYGLDRFSEDLDFSLVKPDEEFDFSKFFKALQDELGAFGFDMTVEEKKKPVNSAIQSAFIKGGTRFHLIKLSSVKPPVEGVNPDEKLRIKIELDIDPPPGALFELKYLLQPIPFPVKLYDASSLFAGKVHAVLCRKWKNRVKGRDFYDFVWYLSQQHKLNLPHLNARLRQTGHLEPDKTLSAKDVLEKLLERFKVVDFEQAKKDVLPFVSNPEVIDLWSEEFFTGITRQYFTSLPGLEGAGRRWKSR
jgi:predicted nucleotidyltransferase component of viral defense system